MKHCPKCEDTKEETEFYRSEKRKDGLEGWCKKCKRSSASIRKKSIQKDNLLTGFVIDFKICSVCNTKKHSSQFDLNRRSINGIRCECKQCRKQSVKGSVYTNNYSNNCAVASLINNKRIDKPSTHFCSFGGCNTFASEYHHIVYDNISKGENKSVITPLCLYHHDIVEINKNDGIDLSDKLSIKIQIERFGKGRQSIITYIKE